MKSYYLLSFLFIFCYTSWAQTVSVIDSTQKILTIEIPEGEPSKVFSDGGKYFGTLVNHLREGHGIMIYANGDKYLGEWKNDQRNGIGSMVFADGGTYEGGWKDDLMEGEGTQTWADGRKYVGRQENDKCNGHGTFTWADGRKYVGELKDGKMNGQGTYTRANGDKYVGEWKDGIPINCHASINWEDGTKYEGGWKEIVKNGYGIFTEPDGTQYEGEWEGGWLKKGTILYTSGDKYAGELSEDRYPEGHGTFTWTSGNQYVGEWKDGKKTGQGTYTWPDGDKYVGEWKDDKRTGQGTYTCSNGDKYVGEWKEDKRTGQGTMTWANGDKYVGAFVEGKFTGQGTHTWANGDKYVGEWKNDKMEGQGTFTWASGNKYIGEWKDSEMNGLGKAYDSRGDMRIHGVWKNGKYIESIESYNRRIASETKRKASIEQEQIAKRNIDSHNDGVCGIYEQTGSSNELKIACISKDNEYQLIYISGYSSSSNWKPGDLKAKLVISAAGIIKAQWHTPSGHTQNDTYVTFDGTTMTVQSLSGNTTDDGVYLKMYPSQSPSSVGIGVPSGGNDEWSGTGFALAQGYIATNYHVVDGASIIEVYGVNGDSNTKVMAEIVATDKQIDLAILKLKGATPANIPYAVKTSMAEVGDDVWVLGYPMTQTMGDEIKLTNGIVSARSGFDGDKSLYQISAPIQPGNSGGPLFDENGNVIGIVCAHHKGAELVSYAIKASYLRNLMESEIEHNILPQTNRMAGQKLSEKVKQAKKYVYFIHCTGSAKH